MVLRTRRQGETDKLVTLFTEDHGKVRVMANGARRPKSRFAGCLEVGWSVHIACSLRDDRDLHTLSEAELVRSRPALVADLRRLSYAAAACEIVDRLTIEHEASRRLFRCLTGVLGGLEEVEEPQLESLFWYYQLRVAEALGYRPELGVCVVCGSPPGGGPGWFSPPSAAACAVTADGPTRPATGRDPATSAAPAGSPATACGCWRSCRACAPTGARRSRRRPRLSPARSAACCAAFSSTTRGPGAACGPWSSSTH